LTESRCPECGRGFSPDDPHSVNCGKPYGRRGAAILRPTRWIAPAAPWVSWGTFTIAAVLLCDRLLPLIILALFWIIFLFPYAIRGTLRNLAIRVYRQPREFRKVDRAGVRRILVSFSVPFMLMFSGLPLHIPFYLSLPWINRIARLAYEGEPVLGPYPPPQWAGFYRVNIENASPRSVNAQIGGVDLVYYPGPADHTLPGWFPWDMTPIGGGWYRWHDPSTPDSLFPWGW
jgi:hypothetical protein